MVEIMKKRHLGRIAMLAALLLSGCAINQPAIVHQPMAVRPPPPQLANPDNGAIYDVATYRPLFEDYKARLIGDLLTVELTERNSASKSSESSVDRENDIGFSVPTVSGVAGKSFQGAELEAESDTAVDPHVLGVQQARVVRHLAGINEQRHVHAGERVPAMLEVQTGQKTHSGLQSLLHCIGVNGLH